MGTAVSRWAEPLEWPLPLAEENTSQRHTAGADVVAAMGSAAAEIFESTGLASFQDSSSEAQQQDCLSLFHLWFVTLAAPGSTVRSCREPAGTKFFFNLPGDAWQVDGRL